MQVDVAEAHPEGLQVVPVVALALLMLQVLPGAPLVGLLGWSRLWLVVLLLDPLLGVEALPVGLQVAPVALALLMLLMAPVAP